MLGSQTSEVDTYYDTVGYGLPTQVNEYDWGPTLSRTTITAYDYNTSCGVTNTNVVDLPCSVRIENSSGGTVASTTYTYDSNGDMLSETPLAGPAFAFTYNSNGTMKTSADPSGTTTYSYGSNSCNAFADTTTPPISSLATTAVWSCNPAVMTSSKDANGNQTSYAYNDPFNRLTSTTYPDGGSVTITYNSETGTTTTTKITSAVSRTDTTYLDGLGRVLHQTVAGVITNLSYDSLGRVATVGIANSGAQDTYSYDALNRVTKATHADSTNAQTSYSNNCATTTDEASKVRGICTDGLGRTSVVTEDPNGLDYQTSYSYDVLNDLTGVSQASESRSYYYDGLGRITQSTTPDAGTVNYSYDSDSTCSITSAGDLVKRVDARSIRTCYAYDSMHRLTQKNYSDGTATANYYYDQSSYNGLAISNGLGRNTGMSDGSGETAWSYDAMGRALTEEKTIASITKTVGYTYNYDGSLASITYPSGRKITYGVDSLGRPQPAQDTTNGINYAGSATYAAQGALASVLNGETSSFGGITYSIGYNNRLWPSSISASSSNGTALSLAYSTYYPNGNVEVITNNRDNGRTVTYGYDSLNRINSASSQATSGADCWGQAIPSTGYDRYGNLLTITVTKCTALALSISVNGNNQVSGFSYDAAGDVTNDGTYTYAWDAEGRLKSAAGVTYTYDRAGQRVEKSSGTLYWLGTGASVLAETDTSGNTLNEYIFFAGMRVARRDGSGNIYYYFQDRMGTNRTIAYGSGSNPGALCYDADFYPFGGELAFTNNCAQNYKFAGMERDPETLNDHTLFRSYRSNYGRWLSPDPGDLAAADPTNPQSWNRYAYVLDNPVNVVDPRGLDGCTYSSEDGIWDCPPPSWAQASFSGLPPQPSNQPTASNNWLNSTTQGGDWGSCAPTGLSNSCTPGANPWSGELSSGFQQVVNLIKNDINENLGLNAQAASADMNIIQYGSMDDFLAAVSALELIQQLMAADQNALGLLQSWQPGATGNPPNASGKCSAVGPILAQWANALRACTKAHPGQAPPPSLATPPNVNGVC